MTSCTPTQQKLCKNNTCELCESRSFASSDKAKYWSEKNGDVKPRDVFKSSRKKYLFDCFCGHEFDMSLDNMSKGQWCPYCSNQKLCKKEDCLMCFDKSFASNERAKYWSEKNKDVKPRDIFKGSSKNFFFNCDCSHEFVKIINDITNKDGGWCPYCSNPPQKLCKKEDCLLCFNKSFASSEYAKYWSENNGDVKPRDIFNFCNKKYCFNCSCGHKFDMSLGNISKGLQCPYCSIPQKKLCDNNNCMLCFSKSFASSEYAKYWSEKNRNIKPRDVFKSSGKKYWFNCVKCPHKFEISLHCVSRGQLCPYCSNPPQKLCKEESCIFCFNNSFASSEYSKYWSEKNGDIKPRNVFKSSSKKYFFNCLCVHKFYASLNHIFKGTWCPYCSNPPKKLCKEKLCMFCFNNSFASSPRAKNWSDKNNVNPLNVFKCSNKKYWFDCDKCSNDFEAALNNVSHGQWCPYCTHKTELKLNEYLKETNTNFRTQPRYDWCRNPHTNKHLPFDYSNDELKLIIELDGDQHFKQVSNWADHNETRVKDVLKMYLALKNGYTVIRLLQDDVFFDKNNWKEKLNSVIKSYNTPDVITICDGKKYKVHLSDLAELMKIYEERNEIIEDIEDEDEDVNVDDIIISDEEIDVGEIPPSE
jgi:hypothetical protein